MLQGIFLRSYIYPYLAEFLYVVQDRPECSNALEATRPERAEAPSPGHRPGKL